MTRTTPILIVGAGPTGLALANLLGCAGVPAVLVERNRTTSDLPRAVSFDDEAFRTLQACGFDEAAFHLIVQGTGTKYYGANGRLLAYQRGSEPPPLGHPVKNPFSQPELERVLRGGLGRFDQLDVRFSTELVGLHVESESQAKATLRDAFGAEEELWADLVVGCDGGRSFVREAVGVKMNGSTIRQPWLVVDVLDDVHDERYAMHHCRPQRPCVVIPGRNGRCRYEFMMLPGEDPAEVSDLASVQRLLAPFRSISEEQIERCAVYTFHALVADRWRAGPVLLAGDAAHMMPPFAGQGLNSGIRDAANLAWKLAAVAGSRAHRELLDTYEAERRPHAEATVRFSARLGKVMMSRRTSFAFVRDAAIRGAMRIPPVGRYVAEGRFRPRARFRAPGAVVASGDPEILGRMLPQPRVLLADGRRCLLDDALGEGFWLLAIDPAPTVAPALDHAVWTSLTPTYAVVLLDDRTPRLVENGPLTVADLDGSLAKSLAGCRGKTLLVRPDRFVAAVLPADPDQGADEIGRAFSVVARPSPHGDRAARAVPA